jgi:hypothetical protein
MQGDQKRQVEMSQAAARKRILWVSSEAGSSSETKGTCKSSLSLGRDLKTRDELFVMSKSSILLSSLVKFFSNPENKKSLDDILNHKNGISLRRIEWFVTNYAKNKHVTYTGPNGKMFTVHVAYKSSLDGYSKKLFDPFCRTERIEFEGITTTVAQLNFLKWVIQNEIVNHMLMLKKGDQQSLPEIEESCSHSKTHTDCSLVGPV